MMTTIVYPRHFLILLLAAAALLFASPTLGAIPGSDARLVLGFGLPGALHATSLVLSLRRGPAVGPAITFVAMAAVWSVLTPFSPGLLFFLAAPIRALGASAGIIAVLAFGSMFGATGYWFLVRRFWLKSLRLVDWVTTVALCLAATVLSFWSAGLLMPKARNIADMLPTLAWWAAFSISLYWSEVRGSARNSRVDTLPLICADERKI